MNYGCFLSSVRNNKPLIYNITNYVTVNDVANAELAIGASPIMSEDINEAKDLMNISSGLNINIGTLSEKSIETMTEAGKYANKLKKPAVLDPVGVGASKYRIDVTKYLIQHVDFSVIKGNASEINTLDSWNKKCGGVDVDFIDVINKNNYLLIAPVLRKLALLYHTIVIATGEIDMISDGNQCAAVFNGRNEMTSITGCGCILSGLLTSFVACSKDKLFDACVASVITMGIAGEIGFAHLLSGEGNLTYRNRIIDALYNMLPSDINTHQKVEFI